MPDRAGWCQRVPRVVFGRLMPDRAGQSRRVPHSAIESGLRTPRTGRARSSPADTFRHQPTPGGTARHTPEPHGTIRHCPYPAGRSGICCGLLPVDQGRPDSKRHHPDHADTRRHPATHIDTFRHSTASRYGAWRQGLVRCGEAAPIVSWIVTAVSGSTSPKRPRSSTSQCSALRRD